MKFTKIPEDTFKKLQLNSGVLATSFVPETGAFETAGVIGATTGNLTFSAVPRLIDNADGINNAPRNMMELTDIDYWDVNMSGAFITVDAVVLGLLLPSSAANGVFTPAGKLEAAHFRELWWIGDYSDITDDANGGYAAIHMLNVLNTGGFRLQTTDNGKGQFAFDFKAHYSLTDQSKIPFEVYLKAGTAGT